jgi:hypothetical protein
MVESTKKTKKNESNLGLTPNMELSPSLTPWFATIKLLLVPKEAQ